MLDFAKIREYVDEDRGNYVAAGTALAQDVAGMRIFDQPLFAVGDAQDPLFQKLQEPQAVGPHMRLPQDWLPGARSVVSFFLPFTEAVKGSNAPRGKSEGRDEEQQRRDPSNGWLHGRIEGQAFLLDVCRKMVSLLEAEGEEAVIPILEPGFWTEETSRFTSSWSERHVAFVCGLGTFGLSKGLITEKGICGRFGSVVTTAELPRTERPYTGIYEYCIQCGACARNCPVGAISLEKGKDHVACGAYCAVMKERYAPRYGCGKCQVSVPCMSRIPGRRP